MRAGSDTEVPGISVVVVTYNSQARVEDVLQECESIAAEGYLTDCVLVDCASRDATREVIHKWTESSVRCGTYLTLWLPENVGFPVAANMGARKAQGRTVLFLNPDVYGFVDAAIGSAIFLSRNPEVGVCGPVLLQEDGTPYPESARPLPTSARLVIRTIGLGRLANDVRRRMLAGRLRPIFPQAISGAFMAVRRETLERVGYLDERLFMYLEDVEYCQRLADSGYRVACLPWLRAWHAAGSSRHSLGVSASELDVLAGEVPWLLAMDRHRRWQARLASIGALLLAGRLLVSRRPMSRLLATQLVQWSFGPKPRYVGWRPSFAKGRVA